jgi:DNA mismatch endonuclease (patch repair protein)
MSGRPRPTPLNDAVSREMQRMPRASTRPELLIRRELHHRGLRFRINYPQLPGRPDIAFTNARVAVFIDGCFWHACPDHGVLPRNNREWWQNKLERNVARDRKKDSQLDSMGWTVVHVWEHQDPIEAANTIEELWRSRRQVATRRVDRAARQPKM